MDTGGGGSLRASASMWLAGTDMPLAVVGFMVVLSGLGSALWAAIRRMPRASQAVAGRPGR